MPRPVRAEDDVFINCPFDGQYASLFNAVVFAIFDCGFRARCALEKMDSGRVRIDQICGIIKGCTYGIHDLSRVQLDQKTGLPRFNMPLELGIFLGAQRFGTGLQRNKRCLVLDTSKYRYQKFISDIAGQDIEAHGRSPKIAVLRVRDWLNTNSGRGNMPGGQLIWTRFGVFTKELPLLVAGQGLDPGALSFPDYTEHVYRWTRSH